MEVRTPLFFPSIIQLWWQWFWLWIWLWWWWWWWWGWWGWWFWWCGICFHLTIDILAGRVKEVGEKAVHTKTIWPLIDYDHQDCHDYHHDYNDYDEAVYTETIWPLMVTSKIVMIIIIIIMIMAMIIVIIIISIIIKIISKIEMILMMLFTLCQVHFYV